MNNSIALGARGPNVRPARNRAAAMEGRNAMMQGQMQQMQMDQAMQASQRDAQMRNALAGVDPNADDYYQQAASAVQGIDPVAAAGFVDKSAARNKTQLDSQARQLEMVSQKVKLTGQILGSATSAQDFQMKVAQGVQAGILDPKQGQALLSQPWTPELSQDLAMQGMEADKRMQLIMDQQEFGEKKRHNRETEATGRLRAKQPLVAIDNSGPKEHDKLDAKYYSEMYSGLQDSARGSEKLVMDYKLIDNLIGDAYSGVGANQVQAAKKLARIVGIDAGDASGPEAAAMVSNKLALELRNPAGGAGMPGAMSDKDREFLQGMVPGLTTTKEGRALMVEVQSRIAKRNKEVAKMAREYRLKNKYLDINFEQQVADRFGGKDIFADLYNSIPETETGGEIPSIASDADYDALAPGSQYRDPDGVLRTKSR